MFSIDCILFKNDKIRKYIKKRELYNNNNI